MKRETKLNLIFLTLILAIMTPGAVILFKRKLDPAAAPMYLPDPVRQRLPYMAPQWTPEEVTRVIPELTGQWVQQIEQQQSGHPQILMRNRSPVLSQDRLLQVTALEETATTTQIHLIAWDGYSASAQNYHLDLLTGKTAITGKVLTARQIPMPDNVKKELQNGGYAKPRPWIAWLNVEFAGKPPPGQPFVLQVSYKDDSASLNSAVNLFTE